MTGTRVRPSRAEFLALARDHTVVPVWTEVLADLETPVSAFVKVVGSRTTDAPGFLLESVEHGQRWGRFTFLGRDPALRLVVRGREVTFTGEVPDGVPADQGALAALDALLRAYRAPRIADLPPFHGGIVGYLGYDVVREIEHLPHPPADPAGLPDAVLGVTGPVTAFDHFRQRLSLIENVFLLGGGDPGTRYDEAVARLEARVAELARPVPSVPSAPPDLTDLRLPTVTSSMGGGRYRDAVAVAREHILAGDVFQVVLAQRFDVEEAVDPFDVYRVLRQVNPSPYMYFLRQPEVTLVGSSPEPMVQVLDGRVISRPIAGTRFRGATEEHDRRLAAELAENPKERAEHVMLVDLARNDVGRVVTYGSERMDELMSLERYSHVMHLTSQVSGDLAPGRTAVDVLRATFPAGTVSGAPKVRAMEIIDALEPTKRGPYAGVVGYVDFSGNLDTAIAIRTMVWRDGHASVQAGAGIVADSVAEDEDLECANKARALLTALAAARDLESLE
ncbi:MAG: anthranilate synthase component I [Actinomycetota bacterium]